MTPKAFARIYSDELIAKSEADGRQAELTFELWRGWAAEHAERGEEKPAMSGASSRSMSLQQQQTVGNEGLHVSPPRFAAAAWRRWLGWGVALLISALLWTLIFAFVRFIAQVL